MPESLDILKLKLLLSFQNEDPSMCTVTELAQIHRESKQKVSRMLMAMEKEGLIDRSDTRHPCLTELGQEKAAYYGERTTVILNHLLYEGLDFDNAEQDAYAWALYNSDAGMQILRNSEQRYRAKYELRRQRSFDGAELCSHFKDGDYRFAFLLYREQVRDGNNVSMANDGFEHPCVLKVRGGVGTVCLKPVDITHPSRLTGKEMSGKVRNLRYLDGGSYRKTWAEGDELCFPAKVLRFMNFGQGIGQILHGSVCMKMQCSVGIMHMPESTAIFTMII